MCVVCLKDSSVCGVCVKDCNVCVVSDKDCNVCVVCLNDSYVCVWFVGGLTEHYRTPVSRSFYTCTVGRRQIVFSALRF